jgi:hypothetical protein
MANPTYDWYSGGLTADHNPGASEPWDGIIQYGIFWRNYVNNTLWFCTSAPNSDNTDLEWMYWATLSGAPPANKTIHSVSSPAFNSPRIPSVSKDSHVNALVGISITVLQSSLITAQVDTGSGYVTIAQWGLGALALSGASNTLSFFVPAGATYRLMASGTGVTSISSILEVY